MYRIKSIVHTLQGEGVNAGRAAVFLRFVGCNLWSGHEEDRAIATCKICDTDFIGGVAYRTAGEVASEVARAWWGGLDRRLVICTGGEPALQLDAPLVTALRAEGFGVAIETNGTRPLPAGLDWITVSPKPGVPLVVTRADELRLLYPLAGIEPELFERFPCRRRFLSPLDDANREANTTLAVAYCMTHPGWDLSVQIHKYIGIA